MSGRLFEAVRVVPPVLWRHVGAQFAVAAPDPASLRAMYRRRRTLFEHQELACETLGFHELTEANAARYCTMNSLAPRIDSGCCRLRAAGCMNID